MKIIYSKKFARQYKKLPNRVKTLAEKREKIFRDNPFDSRLKTHKLQGELSGFYSFSIDYSYRIIFDFKKNRKVIRFYFVGDHDIYYH